MKKAGGAICSRDTLIKGQGVGVSYLQRHPDSDFDTITLEGIRYDQ
jgi:hypothetical protein